MTPSKDILYMYNRICSIARDILPNFDRQINLKEKDLMGTKNNNISILISTKKELIQQGVNSVGLYLDVDRMLLNVQVFGGAGGQKIYLVPDKNNPNEKYLAYASVKVPFRKPQQNKDSVINAIEKFFTNYKLLMIENKSRLIKEDKIDYDFLLNDGTEISKKNDMKEKSDKKQKSGSKKQPSIELEKQSNSQLIPFKKLHFYIDLGKETKKFEDYNSAVNYLNTLPTQEKKDALFYNDEIVRENGQMFIDPSKKEVIKPIGKLIEDENIEEAEFETDMMATGGKIKNPDKIVKVMKELKAGKLYTGAHKKVNKRKQALAIALSEAKSDNYKIF